MQLSKAPSSSPSSAASLQSERSWIRRCAETDLSGWLLSGFLHTIAWTSVTAVTWSLVSGTQEPEPAPILAASLADETIVDDAAQLELESTINTGVSDEAARARQFSSVLKVVETGWLEAAAADASAAAAVLEDSDTEGAGQTGFQFQVPKSGLAVTKGSFTAWAEPSQPAPGESYLIIIEIRLPDDVKHYKLSDLSGEVRGTDTYFQKIPWDREAPGASAVSFESGLKVIDSRTSVPVRRQKVQLVVKVPGAAKLVRDTIRIRSRRLQEDQRLTLVFDGNAASQESVKMSEKEP
jgi:hypothetical protein